MQRKHSSKPLFSFVATAVASFVIVTPARAAEDPASVPSPTIYNPLTGGRSAPTPSTAAPKEQSASTSAPAEPKHHDSLQLDLGLAVIALAYERMLEPRIGIQFEAHYFATWFGSVIDQADLRGFGGGVRTSFFLTDDGPRGVYLAPFLRIDRVSAEMNNVSNSAIGFSTGFFLGYSFMLGKRVNLRLGGGGQYLSYGVDLKRTRAEFRSLFPAIDLVVGYVF